MIPKSLLNIFHLKKVCFSLFFIALPFFSPFSSSSKPLTAVERESRIRTEDDSLLRFETALMRAQVQQSEQKNNLVFVYQQIPQRHGVPELQMEDSFTIDGLHVGVCSAKGDRRTQEDSHLATSFTISLGRKDYSAQLFGVFDGHGGAQASHYVAANFQRVLQDMLLEFNQEGLTSLGMYNALKMVGVRLHQQFLAAHPEAPSGSCLTAALIINDCLWTINIGDSRIVLDTGTTSIQLTEDQKPKIAHYKQGILHRGGFVGIFYPNRVNGMLAVARAIGDQFIGPAISSRAKITVKPLAEIPPSSHLILACDGIWDVASSQQAGQGVRANRARMPHEIAADLVYSAYRADSGDNLSAMVVRF